MNAFSLIHATIAETARTGVTKSLLTIDTLLVVQGRPLSER